MAVYQGSLTVKRRPKDGVPGNPGNPGLPGQVPIQKEWVVGDTHRFNDEIKDFIYVRGASSDTSYWYTRTNKGDVVAGSPPVGGANVEGYTRVDWLRTLAVNVLLAEEANLANFIFKDGQLLSVRGTVNGVETNYSGQANFNHYIILDGKTGKIYAEGAEITGVINALSGSIGHLTIEELGRIVMKDPATAKERLIFANQNIPTVSYLEDQTQDDGSRSIEALSVTTGVSNMYSSVLSVTQNGSTLTFGGTTMSLQATAPIGQGVTVQLTLTLERNSTPYLTLGSVNVYVGSGQTASDSLVVAPKTWSGLPSGNYRIKLERTYSGTLTSLAGTSTSSTLSWVFSKNVEWFQFGLNGMMSWWQNVHAYFSNSEISFRAPADKWNAPGVLAAGSSTSGGIQSNVWGAKSSTANITPITGGFRVPLSGLSHSNYVIQITPHTNTTFRVGTKTSAYFEVYGTGGFDYVVIGNNYA